MNSRIYVGQVRHRRFEPQSHEFSYGLFMLMLDLDELPTLFNRFWLWSYNKANLAWFDRKKYSGPAEHDLRDVIRDKVLQQTGSRPEGRIELLTHLKYFGYGFNPVSFYFCYQKDNKTLQAIVAEINNTPWNEQHCYVLPVYKTEAPYVFNFNKSFHVSPFNSMDQQYDWRFTYPADTLAVHMNVFETNKLLFDATLTLQQESISSTSLAKALIKFPFMTLKVVSAIYWQAAKLWFKRVPFYTHPNKQEAPGAIKKL